MGEFKKPINEKEFHENFAQIKPLMDNNQAFYESSRCLFCYDAPCIAACPTEIDIPLFIRQINSNNLKGAAKTIFDSNWMGNACGKVCPTEVLCEGACVYNHQDVKPIEIGRLQNYATRSAIDKNQSLFDLPELKNKKVAIIGAGPAGISCACELRMAGYTSDIFEAHEKPSGLNMYGVAPYKITNQEAALEVDYLKEQFGFSIHYNRRVTSEEDLEELENTYNAIFIGIGLGSTRKINIKNENLKGCFGATEFIEKLRVNEYAEDSLGKRVIVLGGGNTAMDAASESARMGAEEVTIAYRNSKDSMRAYDFEYELAKEVGVKGVFNCNPIEIIGSEKVEGVRFVKTKSEGGSLEAIEGSEFIITCDTVIFATGQSKQKEFLDQIDKLELDKRGRIVVNENFQTGNPKYFAAGDAVNGGAEVVNAAAEGKKAAVGIVRFLES
ncbi:MAG: NAD(P)-dependent oxidoreductase [Chitinophagales bacterium]|nr:NAD(P)-dependent oxidoreductase [Chitinophagales bacterium]